MRVILFFLTAGLLLNMHSQAQTAEDSVKAVVNKLFTAMKTSDTVLLKSCFTDNCILQTVSESKAGVISVNDEPLSEFIKTVATQFKGALDERITFDMVKVDGALASAWTPYKFYYNTQFLHCGVNSFQLARINNTWKIHYLVDTRRKTGCK